MLRPVLMAAALLATSAGVQAFTDPFHNSTFNQLAKRDPSYTQSTKAYQNCVLKDPNYHERNPKAEKYCNPRIQIGECHANSRVMNQVFATFIPDTVNPYWGEGGPYGDCCAYSIYPEEGDLFEWENPNYVCFTWETPPNEEGGKDQGHGPPTLPRTNMQPFPIVCPSNLKNCYSEHVYDDVHQKMGAYIYDNVTFTGLWNPPKGPDHKDLWCNWIGGGCGGQHNLRYFTLHYMQNHTCDTSLCIKYPQSTKKVDWNRVCPIGTFPPVSQFSFYANGGIPPAEKCNPEAIKKSIGSGGSNNNNGGQSGSGSGSGSGTGKGEEGCKDDGTGKKCSTGQNGKGANSGSGSGTGSGSGKGSGKGDSDCKEGGSGQHCNNGQGSGSGNSGEGSGSCGTKHKNGEKKHKKKHNKKCNGQPCPDDHVYMAGVNKEANTPSYQRRSSDDGCTDSTSTDSIKRSVEEFAAHHETFKRHIIKRYRKQKL